MNTKKVFVNGECLETILRHYYAIPTLIQEVRNTKGSFTEWDNKRSPSSFKDSVLVNDAKIRIEDFVI